MANSVIDRQNITSVQFLIDVVLAVTVVVKVGNLKQTTTATATETLPNKRFNEQNNS